MMKRFFSWFGKKNTSKTNSAYMIESLVNMLIMTEEKEISCDDVHELLDQFAELELHGEDVAHLLPLVQHHLDLCPDCKEEHDVLLLALQVEKERDQ